MSAADPSSELRHCETVRVSRPIAAAWTVVSAASVFAFAYLFWVVLTAIEGARVEPLVVDAGTVPSLATIAVAAVALVVIVVVPHELVHGLAMARYDGDASYGVGVSHFLFPYAYARSDPRGYSRNQFVVIALAPLVVITAAGLALSMVVPTRWLAVPLAVNAAGSIADLWMAATVLRFPPDVRITGLGDGAGFELYARDETEPSRTAGGRLAAFALGAVVTGGALVVVAFTLVLAALADGSGTVLVGDPGSTWFLFGHEFEPTAGTAVVTVGDRAAGVVVAAGGVAWTLADALRR